MDVDANDHGEEGIAFSGMYAHIMQVVIIKYPVIYSFTGSAVIVNLLIFIRPPWNRGIESDVPVRLGVDAASIRRRRTFLLTGAGVSFAADKRTAPLTGMLLFTVAPVNHTETCHAQGSAIGINGDRARNGIGPATIGVEVDERPDIPFFAKPISGIVVMGGIKTEVTDRDIRVDRPKLAQGDDGADAVVPPGIQEADMEWEVNANVRIM